MINYTSTCDCGCKNTSDEYICHESMGLNLCKIETEKVVISQMKSRHRLTYYLFYIASFVSMVTLAGRTIQ